MQPFENVGNVITMHLCGDNACHKEYDVKEARMEKQIGNE